MAVFPAASAGSKLSNQNITPDQPRTETEQKTSSASIRFLSTGFMILKQGKCSVDSSVCYSHRGMGSLVIDGNNKLFILTVAHLFNNKPEEYVLMQGNKLFCPFIHATTVKEEQCDTTLIPIGELDPNTKTILIKTNSLFNEKMHFHRQ